MWTDQPTTKDLLSDKQVKRDRMGWEVDFPDFEMPFQKNVTTKVEVFEKLEADEWIYVAINHLYCSSYLFVICHALSLL